MDATRALKYGLSYPYDEREPVDAAHRAALGVLTELSGRSGIGAELENVDDDIKVEIVDELSEIIREAGLRG